MTDGEKRRCPWCWEWIEASATVCEHCNKEVHARESRASAQGLARASGPTLAPAEPTADVAGEATGPQALVDLTTPVGQLMWWGTAILIYGVLLFGVAVGYPAPRGPIALVLAVVQLAAAYLINRALWARMKSWPTAKVTRTMIWLAVAIVVLMLLGWARRRFLP